jgi:hypothetical protein
MKPRFASLFLALATLGGLSGAPSGAAADSPSWERPEDVAFTASTAAEADGVTSIELSPDGAWLYAATLAGKLLRWPVDPASGALGAAQGFAPPQFQDPDGPRGLIGLAFDPVDPSTLWVTDNYPIALWGSREMRPEFSGRLSRIRLAAGDAFEGEVETYLRGLPRSCGDHVTNSIRFRANPDAAAGGPAFLLYLSQGSSSAIGKADKSWCYRPERLLSAAILEIDPSRMPPAGGFDVASEPIPDDGGNRRFGYSWRVGPLLLGMDDAALKTEGIAIDSGPHKGSYLHFAPNGVATVRSGRDAGSALVAAFYDPFAEDAVVRLFATGLRNGYDLVWHSNGWLYSGVNGPAGGGATPDDPRTPVDEGVDKAERVEDYLLRLARGDYGGHPNPLRDEYVVHGGNPTEGVDPNEIGFYPVGVAPDPRYRPERAYVLGHHWSPNGLVEYRADPEGGPLDGALILVNYSKGNNLRTFLLDGEGSVRLDTSLVDPDGAEIVFVDPLDVTLGPGGRLYVATLNRSNGRSQIHRLDPAQRLAVKPAD